MITVEEKKWLEMLRKEEGRGMQLIFDRYYKYLVVTAYNIQEDDDRAKDIVQEVLFDLWKKREQLSIDISLKAYLRRAVVNKSIDEIRSRKRLIYDDDLITQQIDAKEVLINEDLEQEDLKSLITQTIDDLPEKCKLVFKLSRFEDLSHKAIASKLDISTKTIENQITKALKIIRLKLAHYGKLILLFWIHLLN